MRNLNDELSIGQVAKEIGVTVYTLRQWERRYGKPLAKKLDSGHRRYDWQEVKRLRLVVRALALGFRAQKVVPLEQEDLERLIMVKVADQGDEFAIDSWLDSVKNWSEERFLDFCKIEWNNLGPIGFVEQRVGPFLQRLGESWRAGEVSVSQEHYFSHLLEIFLVGKWRDLNEDAEGDRFMIASLAGEEHSLGLHMCAVVLAAAGCKVLFVGQDTPGESISLACRQNPVEGICLSFSSAFDSDRARRELSQIKKEIPHDTVLVAGGAGAPLGVDGVYHFSGLKSFYDWLQYSRTANV